MNPEDRELIDSIWNIYDKDKSDFIDLNEFKKFVSDLIGQKPDRKAFKEMIHITDTNKDGKIQKEEMLAFIVNIEKYQ
jgi:Ca2+-binding EF-hand superfamily protein